MYINYLWKNNKETIIKIITTIAIIFIHILAIVGVKEYFTNCNTYLAAVVFVIMLEILLFIVGGIALTIFATVYKAIRAILKSYRAYKKECARDIIERYKLHSPTAIAKLVLAAVKTENAVIVVPDEVYCYMQDALERHYYFRRTSAKELNITLVPIRTNQDLQKLRGITNKNIFLYSYDYLLGFKDMRNTIELLKNTNKIAGYTMATWE